jgi:hypothetical protein
VPITTTQKHGNSAALAVMIILSHAVVLPVSAQTIDGCTTVPHVRTANDHILESLIVRGKSESQTFRDLVARVDGSDGIVYIVQGVCPYRMRACMLRTVQFIGTQRLLRVVIDVNDYDERDVIVSIGHELAHVMEVLDDQTIRTDAEVVMMYARSNSSAIGGVFETVAATAAGAAIRAEIRPGRIDGVDQKRRDARTLRDPRMSNRQECGRDLVQRSSR